MAKFTVNLRQALGQATLEFRTLEFSDCPLLPRPRRTIVTLQLDEITGALPHGFVFIPP
jgi:hypothetical protein